jgi:diguanylate cyclase (GGDEF)-like protein
MPDSALATLDYERYFLLLREGLPEAADCCVSDITGSVIVLDAGNGFLHVAVGGKFGKTDAVIPATGARIMHTGESGGNRVFSMAIVTPADEYAGSLSVVVPTEIATAAAGLDESVQRLMSSVVSCIEREYRLTIELDAMAQELAGRYEELNLIYDSQDEDACEDFDCDTHNKLVEDYVDYLGVDLVALVFPGQERLFVATNKEDPIQDPYEVIRIISDEYLPVTRENGKCLLVNDFNDEVYRDLALEVPYKIIASPVHNSRGDVEGLLICLNHLYRADFYNSDKNLLTVMAKKVAKVLHANFDALTGLHNQLMFDHMVARALETASTQGLFHCLLNIDLEKLQVVNDSLGRRAGDAAIRTVAQLIKGKLRNTDSVAYLGEGRYGVLLEHCTLEQGERVAETMRSLVENSPLEWEEKSIDLNLAIGLVLIEPHTMNVDEVLEAAEIARQSAKVVGRNRIQTYRQNDTELVGHKQRLQWVPLIQEALRENRFRVYCQTIAPVVADDMAYHFEVLLRLIDKQGEVISPAEFIPPAEQFNMMPTIDRWVIDTAFRTLSQGGYAQAAGEGIVSINLSGQSMSDRELPDYISRKLVEYNIAPACICFEITETAAFGDMATALKTMSAIKALGCALSLDDFGTGLSSFSYLKELPVDYLKIDGSFVRAILDDKVAHAMVASINQVGHVMGLKTVAEFVENAEIMERLAAMQVDYLQGYEIARPVPLNEYLAGLASSSSACAG